MNKKKNIKIKSNLGLAFLSLFSLFIGSIANATELKGSPEQLKRYLHPNKETVSLRGEAKETAYSDKAIVNLIITTEEDELAAALQRNSEIRSWVIAELTAKGIEIKNINTSKFSTSPQFGWFGNSPSSFEIVNRMSVAIFDEKQMVAIAKLSDTSKEVELSGTSYEHTKKKEYLLKVKKKALENALKQKAFYEESLGVKLLVKNFRDSSVRYGGTNESDEFNQRIVITGSRIKRSNSKSKAQKPVPPSPQTFDEVEYSATIYVDFEVVPSK